MAVGNSQKGGPSKRLEDTMYIFFSILFLVSNWMALEVLLNQSTLSEPVAPESMLLAPGKEVPTQSRILFVGDMMFDRTVRQYMEKHGAAYVLSCISDTLKEYDAVIGNLEGPITNEPSVSLGAPVGDPNNTRFTMPYSTAALLAQNNVRAVSLANNHVRDFGDAGIQSTIRALRDADIQFVGDPNDTTNTSTVIDVDGTVFVLVGFNEFFNSYDETIEHIERYAAHMPVIVFAHWGDEYHAVNALQRKLATAFVSSGADLVVGAHPHVVQTSEYIEGVPVYYSLGNFIFDQYWDTHVTQGLMLAVTLNQDGYMTVQELPITLGKDRRTCLTPVTFHN